ncbi:MAG: hypothetical protein K2P20_02090 [Oscillospiraceae bacterium]|nr:hypothetical protein [Oscillospiraceae bacterium]
MKKEEVKFTVRLNPEIAHKLLYIAKYYDRSQNSQISWLAKQCIAEFERKNGKITPEDLRKVQEKQPGN